MRNWQISALERFDLILSCCKAKEVMQYDNTKT